ncbi:MAG TPA: PQQ-dependent sugar dehydrogenase [Longimicrobiales bacterium]
MTQEPPPDSLRLQVVATGLSAPVDLQSPAGDARLFVVEQPGRIRIIQNGQLVATPFLDIRSRVGSGGERGLLGLAFHPNFAANRFFYVNYTDLNGDTRVERYTVPAGTPNAADPASAKLIIGIDQPFSNHNGGQLQFGPDGKLYIGMGDGGSGGDPQNHGQDRSTLLGDLLRIDVDAGDPYGIPADNPYATSTQFRREIWAYGLRNPWRFSFDRTAGLLYVADVGQNAWEEVNAVSATQAGINYGWRLMEGAHCFSPSNCSQNGLQLPVHEYSHNDGCSVTGGYVYRGTAIPGVVGHYFYSDFCSGFLKSFRVVNGSATDHRTWNVGNIGNVLSFGVDAANELYVLTGGGNVMRLAR